MSPRWARNYRLKCTCAGYWFPHRRGGGACDHSKTRDLHLALRCKDKLQTAVEEAALFLSGRAIARPQSTGAPF